MPEENEKKVETINGPVHATMDGKTVFISPPGIEDMRNDMQYTRDAVDKIDDNVQKLETKLNWVGIVGGSYIGYKLIRESVGLARKFMEEE